MFLFIVVIGVLAVAALAIGYRQVGPRIGAKAWDEAKPGSIWFHDSHGDVIAEDAEFKRRSDEGELL